MKGKKPHPDQYVINLFFHCRDLYMIIAQSYNADLEIGFKGSQHCLDITYPELAADTDRLQFGVQNLYRNRAITAYFPDYILQWITGKYQ